MDLSHKYKNAFPGKRFTHSEQNKNLWLKTPCLVDRTKEYVIGLMKVNIGTKESNYITGNSYFFFLFLENKLTYTQTLTFASIHGLNSPLFIYNQSPSSFFSSQITLISSLG